jgi:hypothetical protein
MHPRRTIANPPHRFPNLNDRYQLANIPIGVSPVCIGLVGDPNIIPAAYDMGINFFFVTADMHWPLYENLRRGLKMLFERGGGIRDDVVVGVVSYVTQAEFCQTPFEEVVQCIPALERIDVAIAGGAYANDLLVRRNAYQKHPHRPPAIGASFHDRPACLTALNHNLVDIGFLRYNTIHRGAEEDVFPHLRPKSTALLYNFKSTHGFLCEQDYATIGLTPEYVRPPITDYYRYALSRPEMDGLLCALDTPQQLNALEEALNKGALDDDQIQYLNDLTDLALGRASLNPSP